MAGLLRKDILNFNYSTLTLSEAAVVETATRGASEEVSSRNDGSMLLGISIFTCVAFYYPANLEAPPSSYNHTLICSLFDTPTPNGQTRP